MIEADMDNELFTSLRRLSDDELVATLKDLAARERADTSALVARLAELDTRDIHLRQGYSSLFAYCREVLSLSEHEAYNRIDHLTPENHLNVLASARKAEDRCRRDRGPIGTSAGRRAEGPKTADPA